MAAYTMSQAVIPAAIWLAIYGIGISLMFFPAIPYPGREILFSMVYPFAIYFLTKPIGGVRYTAINPLIVLFAGITSALYASMVSMSKRVRESQRNPMDNKAISATIYVSIALVYALTIILSSRFVDLYKI